jgi:hypothetical protein
MYLRIDEQFADGELQLLSELLGLLDTKIIEIRKLLGETTDPESDGILDRGEYFIGVGVVAIQQYLADTLTLTGIEKKRALNLGPTYSEHLTFVAILNAAANWWKHSAERYSNTAPRKDAARSLEIVTEVGDSDSYQLSNVLAKLLRSSEVTLCSLIPHLILWRSALDKERRKDA